MSYVLPDLAPLAPELWLLGLVSALLIVDLFVNDANRWITYVLAQASLVVVAAVLLSGYGRYDVVSFGGHFVRDGIADLLKMGMVVGLLFVFIYARDYLSRRDLHKGEFYVLGLFALLGMMVIASAQSLLTLYLGLELLSLSLYALVAFNRDSAASSEAAMKYFVLGAIASGMLLYGMSMVYGVTGTLELAGVADGISQAGSNDLVLIFGLVFLVIGVAFKFGAVPFHMWVPDVYDGAPTAVTLFVGSTPKIAALALAIRLLTEGMAPLHGDWQSMLAILAVLSMAVGNIVAIAQTNIKRMLAYSTISHVGFIFLGVLAGTEQGISGAMFYALVYAFMAAGAFGIVAILAERSRDADQLDDLRGLNDRSPWLAFLMMILMLSMAGVPPTAGFFAKLYVVSAVIDINWIGLAITAVVFSVIGAYYYLRIIKLMYFDKPQSSTAPVAAADTRAMLSINALAVLLVGIVPGWLMALCSSAVAGN